MTTTSVRELQRNTKTVLDKIQKTNMAITIMRNNRAVAVLLSNKKYNDLQAEQIISKKDLLQTIKEGNIEYKKGNFKRVQSLSEL